MAAGRRRNTSTKTNRKAVRRRNKRKTGRGRTPFTIAVAIMVFIALAVVGIILLNKYHTYSGYTVDSVIGMSNSEENTRFYVYGDGYLKCASDGVTYFNEDRIIWGENYSMSQPIIDICGDYIAVADMTQRNVFLYDRSGFINRINIAQNIMDIEVTQAGVIAVAASEGNVSYIEIKDRNGDEIMTAKSIFSSSGYLMDLAISDDGSKMAAIYVSVERGTLKSKVVFYDLSGDGTNSDIVAGSFDQYESILMTSVEFMDDDTVCAVGDSALSFYKFKDVPEIKWENLECTWEIQSLMFSDQYVGMVAIEPESDTTYEIDVLDTSGNTVLKKGTDFSYTRVAFAGNNIMMHSGNECIMYSLDGVEKFHGALDEHIEGLVSSNGKRFVYGTNSDTRFITLR